MEDILGDIMSLESVDPNADPDLSLLDPNVPTISQTVSITVLQGWPVISKPLSETIHHLNHLEACQPRHLFINILSLFLFNDEGPVWRNQLPSLKHDSLLQDILRMLYTAWRASESTSLVEVTRLMNY